MKKVALNYANTRLIFIDLLVISIIAFWPTYYAVLLNTDFYVHFHAFTALLWFGMLIAQPFLIKN